MSPARSESLLPRACRIALVLLCCTRLAGAQPVRDAVAGHATLSCADCHGSHLRGSSNAGRMVRISRIPSGAASAGVTRDLGAISRSCLRCHQDPGTRTNEMSPGALVRTGLPAAGRYVGATLSSSHPMGRQDQKPECTTCHLVHVPRQLRPGAAQERQLCVGCHAELTAHPDRGHVASACSACHQVHGAAHWVQSAFMPAAAMRRTEESLLQADRSRAALREAATVGTAGTPPSQAPSGGSSRILTPLARDAQARCISCHSTSRRSAADVPPLSARHAGRAQCLECHATDRSVP